VNVVELFEQTVRTNPERIACIDGRAGRERRMSYALLESESRRNATLFEQQGLQAGDGIVLMLPLSAKLYTVIVAAWRLELVPVFIDPSAGEENFAHCLDRYPVKAFIGTVTACLLRLTSRALRRIPQAYVTATCFPGAYSLRTADTLPEYTQHYLCSPDTPAMLAFTSGSTGRPKGMMRSHGLLRSMHQVLSTHIVPQPGEVSLATMPVFTLTYLACGATILIPDVDLRHPGQADPRRLQSQINRWGVTSAVVSPALLEHLADYCMTQHVTLNSLKKIFVGGAPVFPRLLDKVNNVAAQCEVWVLYGSTEAEPIALIKCTQITDEDVSRMEEGHGLLVGMPIPEISLRILQDRWGAPRGVMSHQDLEQETLKTAVGGEIVVSGPHVAPGYLDPEDDHAIKFRVDNEIWHRTGDAGWLDEQGRLWLLGRCAARIDDDHGQLYPYAVEAALSFQPTITRSAMLLHYGERVLVLEPGSAMPLDIESLLVRLNWAAIDAVVLVKQLPVDARHNAKVDYRKLRLLLDSKKWQRRIDCGG